MIRLAFSVGIAFASLAIPSALADTPTQPSSPTVVAGLGTHKTIYGDAIADADGMTLYVYDGDGRDKSSCNSGCAETWRPLAAPRIAKPSGDWSVVTREDGGKQWAYQGKPLYRFANDHTPGDTGGDGADGKWHSAMIARSFMPTGVAVRPTEFGPTLATGDGRSLYMLVNFVYNPGANGTPRHQKSPPTSACTDECSRVWIPFLAPANAKAEGDWTLVTRDDGGQQWSWKDHPLYTYAQDAKPGDATGEGHWTYIGNAGTHWEVANIVQ